MGGGGSNLVVVGGVGLSLIVVGGGRLSLIVMGGVGSSLIVVRGGGSSLIMVGRGDQALGYMKQPSTVFISVRERRHHRTWHAYCLITVLELHIKIPCKPQLLSR